jgi:hypothetical protein
MTQQTPPRPSAESYPQPSARGPEVRPPRVNAMEAVRRHPLVAGLPVLAFLVAALAIGLTRTPVYTAESRLAVGGIDFSAPGALSGFATASQALASTYARGVEAAPVLRQVSRDTKLPPEVLRSRLSATPLPQSPVIRVISSTSSAAEAEAIANSGSTALADYVARLNRGGSDKSQRFFDEYQRAVKDVQTATLERDEAQTDLKESDTKANRDAVVRARSRLVTAQLRQSALGANYLSTTRGRVAVAQVQPLTQATSASSDRMKRLQLLILIALVAGGLSGVALATLRANRLARRRFFAIG